MLSNPIYGELLQQQAHTLQETKIQVENLVQVLEGRKNMCTARRVMLNTFKKDVVESFSECRAHVKKSIAAMMAYLKNQEDEMLRDLDNTMQFNMDLIAKQGTNVERILARVETQIEEGHSLLREQDAFLFYSKGNLYKQLTVDHVPEVDCPFKDDFPDLTSLSIRPFQVPLQHTVHVDIGEFLSSAAESRICGNIFHKGFRFQIQLKHDGQALSAYLCLKAWHDVAAFLRVTVNFALSLQDGPELIHSATAKNTFSGKHDGWGWNKFVPLTKLRDRTDVLFVVHFNELTYTFVQDEPKGTAADMDTTFGESPGIPGKRPA